MTAKLPMLGIDLGTGTCLACVIRDGQPEYIRPDPSSSNDMMNSVYLAVPRKGGGFDDLVGPDAERTVSADNLLAGHLVRNVKRLMQFEDNEEMHPVSNGRKISPVKVASLYLAKLRAAAERQLGLPPHVRLTSAVVTVPSDFGAKELEATRRACQDAGFHDYHLLDEPVAAAYTLDRRSEEGKELALVADLGQGTFDLALLYLGKEAGKLGISGIIPGGEKALGGLNWDHEIAEWTATQTTPIPAPDSRELRPAEFEARKKEFDRLGHTADDQCSSLCYDRGFGHEDLFTKAEIAKKAFLAHGREKGLTGSQKIAYRPLPGYAPRPATMPSDVFLKRTRYLIAGCVGAIDNLLADVSELPGRMIGWGSLENIYMAGGGSRMWTVRNAIEEKAKRAPILVGSPQHAVVYGAALVAKDIQDGILEPEDKLIGRPVQSHILGVQMHDEHGKPKGIPRIVVPRLTPVDEPLKSRRFMTSGKRTARTLRISFMEGRRPLSANGNSSVNGAPHSEYVWEDFRTYRFPIPPAGPDSDEILTLSFTCAPESNPTMEVTFRGVPLKPEELKREQPGHGTSDSANAPTHFS